MTAPVVAKLIQAALSALMAALGKVLVPLGLVINVMNQGGHELMPMVYDHSEVWIYYHLLKQRIDCSMPQKEAAKAALLPPPSGPRTTPGSLQGILQTRFEPA